MGLFRKETGQLKKAGTQRNDTAYGVSGGKESKVALCWERRYLFALSTSKA